MTFAVALAPVLALAAGVRLWHVMSLRGLPLFDHLIIDSRLYDLWALRIASGDWLGGNRAFYMDPLYPYALAATYRIFGHDLLAVRLLQGALGVGTCALVALVGRRLGGVAVGVLAALLLALYQPLVFEEGEIEKTALGVFLATAALAFAGASSVASRFAAGVCLALATLARGNLLLLAPLMAVYLLLDPDPVRRQASGASPERRWRQGWRGRPGQGALAFLAGFLLALAPVVWRNHHVSGEWILTTSQLGQNFYTGNNPWNGTGAFAPVPFVRPLPEHEEADFRAKAEIVSGRSLSPREVSSFWLREGLAHIAEHPGFAGAVLARKVALTFADLEVPDGWSVYFLRRFSPSLRAAFLTMGWLLPLAAVGAAATIRANRVTRLLVAYVAAYASSMVAFFVFSRYRIYLAPPMAVLAATGACWALGEVRARRWGTLAAAAVASGLVAAASLLAARLSGLTPDAFVHNYAHLAEIYESTGEFGRAEALLQDGLRLRPGTASTLYALGSLRLRLGDAAAAVTSLEQAVRADPKYQDAWYVLGTAYEKAHQVERAKRCYLEQLDRTPGHHLASLRLRRLLARPGTGDAPIERE